jgi:ribonuclease Y
MAELPSVTRRLLAGSLGALRATRRQLAELGRRLDEETRSEEPSVEGQQPPRSGPPHAPDGALLEATRVEAALAEARAEAARAEATRVEAARAASAALAERREAERLVEEARREADRAAEEARREAERLVEEARARARLEAQVIQGQAEALLARSKTEAAEIVARLRTEAEAAGRAEIERLRAHELERLRVEGARAERQEQALIERERGLLDKERVVVLREAEVARRERESGEREARTVERETASVQIVNEQRARLEALAGLSGEEARRELMARSLDEVRRSSAREAKQIEDLARDEAEKRAKRILGIALQRYAGDHAHERSVSTVHLPNDELKGRIIGREGRNIRALQEATGVDLIVDDTPETIVVSCFDPVRREVARVALERLIVDGRIHPTRIEEVVAKARLEVEGTMREAGLQALEELGVARVHPELGRLLGQLRFRYSYAQNVLRHSVECGYIAGLMAGELGLDVRAARRAGLLHDLGKAVSHEVEGGHAMVGASLARRHGEDEVVSNAIGCHHDDEPCISVYGHLVTAADALSGARPGARREVLESHVKRVSELEVLSAGFVGVERAYAIQAGREVRVIVEPSEVSDEEAALLAREISRRIEDELAYPGQIRVTVVRETRAVDYAR